MGEISIGVPKMQNDFGAISSFLLTFLIPFNSKNRDSYSCCNSWKSDN